MIELLFLAVCISVIVGFCLYSFWFDNFASQSYRCERGYHDLGEEYVGIHSALRMGCHKQDCRYCGVTMEHWPA